MASMFRGATAFNNGGQPLDWADTSLVEDMSSMFQNAASFNQDIQSWNANPSTCNDFATDATDATDWLAAYPGGIAATPPLNTDMALVCAP